MNQSEATSGRRTLLLLLSGALLLAFGWMLAVGDSLQAAGADPAQAAMVNGQAITMQEVEAKAADRLEQLDLQRQQMEIRFNQERQNLLLQTAREMVEERVLSLEAAAAGKSSEQLLTENVKAAEVTDADVDAFYVQLQAQRPQGLPPKESIAGQIKTHLQGQKQQEARNAYLDTLRTKYKAETILSEPRLEVAADGPARGPATAPVTIVEFSDFECPFCARVVPTLEQVKEKYGDQVRIVFRQYPLDMHPNAAKAAEASLCAQDQGKFWEMHDAMFADQKKLAVADLKATAGTLGLDAAAFGSCLDSGKHAGQVKADFKAGTLVGVSGTPALFVNGRFLNGAVPFEAIAEVIDEELARAKNAKG
jgi:protein-disulfide isomerase